MLQFFDAVRDDEGVDTVTEGFSVAVAVISLRCVDANDDNFADDVKSDTDDCEGNDVIANDIDALFVVFAVDNNGDDESDVNVIDDVLSDDVDFHSDNAADDVNASANDDGVADAESAAIKTLAVAVAVAVTLVNSGSDSMSVDSEAEPELFCASEFESEFESEAKVEAEVEPEPELEGEAVAELFPRRYRRKRPRLCFFFGLG